MNEFDVIKISKMRKNIFFLLTNKIVEKPLFFALTVLFSMGSIGLKAQTTLYPGDIAITGVNMDNPDEFSILFLTDIEIGTVIYFTDNGWMASGSFRTGEGTDTWTAATTYSSGDQITITAVNMNLSASGDQILAYQGSEASPSFIAAINDYGSATWQADATDANTSAIPNGLTNGVNCVALTETDNIKYNESLTTGTSTEILAAINDYTNWTGNNSTPLSLSTTGFSITSQTEPSNYPTSFQADAGSTTHKDVTLSWNNNDGSSVADGFLILIIANGGSLSFTTPTDGLPVVNDTDLSDDRGSINVDHGVVTYTWTNLDPSKGYDFVIYPYTSTGSNIDYKTDGTAPTASATTAAAPNANSEVEVPASQVAATSISSLYNTAPDAVDVFSFVVTDQGTSDGLPTNVTNVRIRPYATNTTDWTDLIQGVVLNDGSSDITIQTTTITDTYIDLAISSGDMSIADGTSATYTLAIYLNTTNIDDQAIFSCYIDQDATGFTADEYYSTFTADPMPANVISNEFTIDVTASKLIFNSAPTNINVGADFSVEVWATDANNNLDIDETASITLSDNGTGTLSSTSSLTQSLSGGIASWTDLQYDVVESFNLTADDASSLSAVSTPITAYASGVATPGSIIISEMMPDPFYAADDVGEWFELYNANSTFGVDIIGWTFSDAGGSSFTISGSLTIPAEGFIVLGVSSDTGLNGNYTPDYTYSGFGLNNSGADEIIISNDDAVEINRVEYDTGNGWTVNAGASLIFTGSTSDENNDASLWTSSTLHENAYLVSSNTDLGSPGTNGFLQNLVSASTWTGTGNWSEGNVAGISNWSNGVPGAAADVTINGGVTVDITTPAACNNLTISLGDSLTVAAGKALTVNGDLSNNSGTAAGVMLLSDGTSGVSSLITLGSISGEATVQSYFADLNKWYLISSPINNAKGNVFTDDYFYTWDEPNYAWINVYDINYNLQAGQGYTIYKTTNNTTTYSGTLNTGNLSSPALSYTNTGSVTDGWNLMGNPYPSVIDISLLDFTELSSGVHVNLHNETTDYYVFWSKTLGTVGSSGGDGDDRARYIQPGQGFWVQTHTDGTTVDFSNILRTHQNQDNFSKSSEVENAKSEVLKISFNALGMSDPTYIAFRERGTTQFDWEYDLHKMLTSNAQVPHIFSLSTANDSEKMAVNAIEQPLGETSIPIGVRIGTSGTYQITFNGLLSNFTETPDAFLVDRINNAIYNLKQTSSIDFDYIVGQADHRFDLIFGLQTNINNPSDISPEIEAYSYKNRLYIRSGENTIPTDVQIKNLLGQDVYSVHYDAGFVNGKELQLPSAAYLLEIVTNKGIYSKKIFIQN